MHAMASLATMACVVTPLPVGTVTPKGRPTIIIKDIGEGHHTGRITDHTIDRGMDQVIHDLITSRGRYISIHLLR